MADGGRGMGKEGAWGRRGGEVGMFCSCDARCQGLTTLDHAGNSIAICQDLNQLTMLGLRVK